MKVKPLDILNKVSGRFPDMFLVTDTRDAKYFPYCSQVVDVPKPKGTVCTALSQQLKHRKALTYSRFVEIYIDNIYSGNRVALKTPLCLT